MTLRIGVDLDNTIVCLDPPEAMTGPSGAAPQGLAAPPFPGALEFFRRCRKQSVPVVIVGQRPQHSTGDPARDLWDEAGDWLARQGFFNAFGIGLPRGAVFIEPTRDQQAARLASFDCTHVISADPILLGHPALPRGAGRVFFEPHPTTPDGLSRTAVRARGWSHVTELLLSSARR